MGSQGTSNEPSVTVWGDGQARKVCGPFVSDMDPSHEAEVHVDVVDFDDHDGNAVTLHVEAESGHCVYLTAYDAERLGTFLIQAAALSRMVERRGHNPLLIQQIAP